MAVDSLTFWDLQVKLTVPCMSIQAAQQKTVLPLCSSSCHSFAVHKSWPLSVLHRVLTLSDDRMAAYDLLCKRYLMANACPSVLQSLLDSRSLVQDLGDCHEKSQVLNTRLAKPMFVFVLRFNQVFQRAFTRALSLAPLPADINLRVVAAWRNSAVSVSGSVNRHKLTHR